MMEDRRIEELPEADLSKECAIRKRERDEIIAEQFANWDELGEEPDKALDHIPDHTQMVCEDAVSRSQLMMHLADLALIYSPGWGANGQGNQDVYDFIKGLQEQLETWPSVQPERKVGFWNTIERGEHGYSAGDFRCSACGKPNPCWRLSDFCPNCGAYMGKGEPNADN